MSTLRVVVLVVAGIGGGLTGSIAGLASLITYPVLLATGISPIAANVTNTTALVFSGIGSGVGSRPELAGQAARLKRLVPLGVLGGAVGAVAVLFTSSHAFELIVPWLILSGALVILIGRAPRLTPPGQAAALDRRSLSPVTAAVSVYGGYFGAAAGVLLLAALLASTRDSLARANAAKNIVLGSANLSATVAFAIFGPVHWSEAVPLGIGCLFGSRIGPIVVRRVPAAPLRVLIGVFGIGLAVVLAAQAYA